jgi:tetratricopeptide (TPR) repeat protein
MAEQVNRTMRDLIGRTLGHYRIVEKIGAGGMGEVFRAHDERLDRDVAIKVLPAEVAQTRDRLDRFEREARAVAKLDHPNILAIHDFGTDQGVTYAVTELLDGQNLRQSIPASGMPWQKAVEIGAAIADGLAAAHGKGIVHRDLKPENIFLTADGRIKILDFGLAQVKVPVEEEAETATLTPAGTIPGTVMGTMGYMSPEQLRGQTVDARSDIFALGCVLYEMLGGVAAFRRGTTAEISAAILKEDPRALTDSGILLPSELDRTVRRCLEKSAEARFQSASDLAYNLRANSTAPAPVATRDVPHAGDRRKAIAGTAIGFVIVIAVVLTVILSGPLRRQPAAPQPEFSPNRVAVVQMENRTGDPSLDTVGVLAADAIVQRFTESAAAEVVLLLDALEEALSTERDRDQRRGTAYLLERARQRGAGLVLSGAYYLDGDTLRLQARLVDVATGDLIHAFQPVGATRDAVADGIDSLSDRLMAGVAAHVAHYDFDIAVMRPPSTYEAYQAYRQGDELFGPNWPGAIVHYRRALGIDQDFHLARIQLVWSHINIDDYEGARNEHSVLEKQLDRMTLYERTYVQYQKAFLEWDRSGALNALRRMQELAPQIPWHPQEIAFRALELNRPREAVEALEPSIDRPHFDSGAVPQWPLMKMTSAQHMLGDYERELEYAGLGLKRFPGLANFFFAKARALAAMGRTELVDEVIDEFLRVQTRGGSPGGLMSATASEFRAHGHHEAADEMAVRSVKWYETHPSALPEESGSVATELWMIGYPDERKSLANALWIVGRWHDIGNLIVRPIDTGPSEYKLAGWLGVIAAIKGDDDLAVQVSDDLPVSDSPRAVAWGRYWQACIAAHLGEKERAVELLAEAFSKGYPFSVLLHSSMDFEPLWDYPPFEELIEPKG